MSRYDRYVLSQYLLFFGFFALVLVGVFWINRAVVLFDRLIGGGQSALVFFEFSALTLPNLIRTVVPMAAFAAAVFVTNRMNSESELTVMQATGSSPARLARPVLVFGALCAAAMLVLSNVLMPAAAGQLAQREAEISRNVTATLLTEGSFLHPAPGVTFYVRAIDPDGTLNDVFLSDRRRPIETVTYTASRAFLVRNDEQTNLIMVDGLVQRLDNTARKLSTTTFSDFSYDISGLMNRDELRTRALRAVPTLELLAASGGAGLPEAYSQGKIAEELHGRIARSTVCIAVTLIGFSTLLLGGYSRFGVWRQAFIAFLLLVLLEVLRGPLDNAVSENAALWPILYLPTLVGIGLATLMLRYGSRPFPRPWRRHDTAEVAP